MNDVLKSINWKQYLISFVFILVSLIVFFVSVWFFIDEKNKLSQTQMALAQQKSINDAAEQSVLQLKNYYNEYKLLKDDGLIGDPPRLEWAEVLLEKYYDIKIPGLYFMLSPTGLSKPEDTFFTSDLIEIKKTPMQINFNLLHEGDFYFYMRHLHQQAKGQFNVEECQISRIISQAEDSLANSFSGECKILWISMSDISAGWPQGIEL
jgi:hypothetical protein